MECLRLCALSHLLLPLRARHVPPIPHLLSVRNSMPHRAYSTSRPKASTRQKPQDIEIEDRTIMVIDGDGPPAGPFRTGEVISRLENHEVLIMLQRAKEGQPAVCKIMVRSQLARKQEAQAAKQRELHKRQGLDKKLKEVVLTWAIAEHDLGIKMRQLKGFLAKGYRVEVLVGKRKKGTKMTQMADEDKEEVLRRVKSAVGEVGGVETRAESRLQGMARLYIMGKDEVVLEKEVKELGVVWGEEDLGKLSLQLTTLLTRGCRVEIVVGKRKKGVKMGSVKEEDKEELMERVRRAVELAGGMETRTEVREQDMVRLFVEEKGSRAGEGGEDGQSVE
ncbi:hypothetical protein CDD81_6851 [Ophiocordyceps australis]|uniref:Translation initiation factor 3 C-terminal domain-containing protein n=1 Tax=Ophiocordyceps australis TaxID=1399860 RepID=A0A2C5Y1Q3_9HYPO|nr:hypothetical protein CDD81_6851 [Ophiocordyceps australis]